MVRRKPRMIAVLDGFQARRAFCKSFRDLANRRSLTRRFFAVGFRSRRGLLSRRPADALIGKAVFGNLFWAIDIPEVNDHWLRHLFFKPL
jgi:hypothetical protein